MSDPVCLQRRLQSHRPPTWHQYNLRSSSATTLSSAHPSPTIPSPPLKCITPSLTSLPLSALPFDIHSYPATDLLKLLALLLTHIATTNDHLSTTNSSSGSSSDPPSSPLDPIDAPPLWYTLTTASQGAISTSAATLTFHARNVPTISVEAYLLRILKYCPTTNHVFLSLLVYFDRMSKLSEDSVGRAFVIDSFNIHRLVIAGITVASKFFSDVFYTNSRYAKVCLIVTCIFFPLFSTPHILVFTVSLQKKIISHPSTSFPFFIGWRSATIGTQPTRTPISPPERFPTSHLQL